MITLTGEYTEEMAAPPPKLSARCRFRAKRAPEVVFADEEEIRELNAGTRGVDKVTDVLSYPALTEIMPLTADNYPFDGDGEGRVFLGSVVHLPRRGWSVRPAEYGHSAEREETYLFTHGLLHLLGYDHIEEEERRVMREAEERVLSAIGITR